MQQRRKRCGIHSQQYRLVKATAVFLTGIITWVPGVYAADNERLDATYRAPYVHGALTESACRLEMASAHQEIWLGETGTARLTQIGSQGTPVAVRLRLRDCLRGPASHRDQYTGNVLWDIHQPAVSVSFAAAPDADNPQLIGVHGSSGVALRLVDPKGRDVSIGNRGAPLMLGAGQDTLDYLVMPERTHAPLKVGDYSAHVDFRLSYD